MILSDRDMLTRTNVFEQRAAEGWNGNGYDWTSIARVILAEKLSDLKDEIEFDSEAGMFAAYGPMDALKQLGVELKRAFDDPDRLRDYLSRAQLD